MDILLLQRKGLSQRQIAKKLGISRNTVKKFIENRGDPEEKNTIQRKSLLDPFDGNIAYWLLNIGPPGFTTDSPIWVLPVAMRL